MLEDVILKRLNQNEILGKRESNRKNRFLLKKVAYNLQI